MTVSRSEFEARNLEVDSKFERLQSDLKSSYASIGEFLTQLQASNVRLEDKLDVMESKFDHRLTQVDQRLTHLATEVSHMRSNFNSKFDIISAQLRLIDQGQFRTEERLSNLERRVDRLEEKAS